MDTNRLRYFCAVANTGNIHRAAELLGLSPAALSKAIKLLENEVDLKLVVPSGRGIVLTTEGRAFAQKAGELLLAFERLKTRTRKHAEERPRIRMGSFEVFATHCLGPLMRELAGLGGEVELLLHELVPGKLEEALVADQLDLGVTYVPIASPGLDFMKVTTITMGVYGRPSLLRATSLGELPFVVPATPFQGTPSKVMGLDGWPDHLVRRTVRYRVSLMESALELCRFGRAVAFLPSFIVELHNAKLREEFRLEAFPEALPLKPKYVHQPVYLIKRRADPESTAIRKIARALRILCREE